MCFNTRLTFVTASVSILMYAVGISFELPLPRSVPLHTNKLPSSNLSPNHLVTNAVDLGGMQGSLNKMAPASRQWRQAADWARELAQLVDTMQTWLARQLCSALPFQKVSPLCVPFH